MLILKYISQNYSESRMALSSRIYSRLSSHFSPKHLEVINESFMHNVPKGSETHFKVIIVSDLFEGKNLVQRHREINTLFKDEFASGLHAFSIVAKTPKQWTSNTHNYASPPCMGGSKM